jgi:DNA-nicking Smr family endonuclease
MAKEDLNEAGQEYPIDGTLDLHQFDPSETKGIVDAYIEACLERKIYKLRIVHGKGIGVQREMVQAFLRNDKRVNGFRHEQGSGGGWGATVVELKQD